MKIALALLAALLFAQQPPATAVIRGTVVNAITGEPLKDARLTVSPPRGGAGALTATTGPDGKFELAGLEAGGWTVIARLQGYSFSGNYRGAIYNNGRYVTVESGQRVENIRIGLVPAFSISGKILDENGKPAEGVPVQLATNGYRPDGKQFLAGGFGSARTDSNGEYRMTGVLPGQYYISAMVRDGDATYYPGVRLTQQAVPIVLTNADLGGLVFPLRTGEKHAIRFRVSGLATMPKDFSFLLRGDGDPSGMYKTLPIPPDGIFTLTDVRPGTYDLTIQWDEEQPPDSPVNPIRQAAQNIPVDVIDRDLDLGMLTINPRSSVNGKITFRGMEPFRVNIILEPYPTGFRTTLSSGFYVDEKNGFSISNVTSGRYLIRTSALVEHRYLASAVYNGTDVLGKETLIDGTTNGWLDIVIDGPPGNVEGVVRDSKGDPFGDATVVLLPPQGRRDDLQISSIKTTDQTGKFSFTDVPPGEYTVLAWEYAPMNAYKNAEWLKPYELRGVRVSVAKGTTTSANVLVILRDK